MNILTQKTALITGAAAGIGRAIALRLAREQVQLELLDCDEKGLAIVAGEVRDLGGQAKTHLCDLRQPVQLSVVLSRIIEAGGVDIVINNAGVGYCGPTHEMSSEHWDRVLSINLLAPVQIVRELLPSLLARSEAHLVNIGSMAGLFAGARLAAYNVSKFGLQGLSESLRAEYGRSGLGVTAVCPGFASTGIFAAARRAGSPQEPKRVASWLMTTPEHIAERTLTAIRNNQPLVVITPLARILWFCKRLAPGLFLRLFTSRYRPSRQYSPQSQVDNPVPVTANAYQRAA